MDAQGNIYELSPEEVESLATPSTPEEVTKEDVSRLEGFLRGRAEAYKLRQEKIDKRRGVQIWDSQRQGTYRKKGKMGIEGIEELSGGDVQNLGDVLGQSDPGDEQPTTPEPAQVPGDDQPVETPAPDTTPPGGDNPLPTPDTTPPTEAEPSGEN